MHYNGQAFGKENENGEQMITMIDRKVGLVNKVKLEFLKMNIHF
jgi:hypothetical protein